MEEKKYVQHYNCMAVVAKEKAFNSNCINSGARSEEEEEERHSCRRPPQREPYMESNGGRRARLRHLRWRRRREKNSFDCYR